MNKITKKINLSTNILGSKIFLALSSVVKKIKRALLFSASSIVVSLSLLVPQNTYGQNINVGCAQLFSVGEHIACSVGTLRIRPNNTTVITGCLSTLTAPQAGQCTVSVTGAAPTRDVVVEFPTTPINITDAPNSASVNIFRLEKTTAAGTAAAITYTPGQITAPVVLNVGGTLSFVDNQPDGMYSGGVNIRARFD